MAINITQVVNLNFVFKEASYKAPTDKEKRRHAAEIKILQEQTKINNE